MTLLTVLLPQSSQGKRRLLLALPLARGNNVGAPLFTDAIAPSVAANDNTSLSELFAVLAATEADDIGGETATVDVIASAAITEADEALSSFSTVDVAATLSVTETGDTLAAAGAIDVAATLAVTTEADDSLASTGTIAVTALVAGVTEASDALSATVANALAALATISEASDSLVSTGQTAVAAVDATAEVGEDGDTLATTATIAARNPRDLTWAKSNKWTPTDARPPEMIVEDWLGVPRNISPKSLKNQIPASKRPMAIYQNQWTKLRRYMPTAWFTS